MTTVSEEQFTKLLAGVGGALERKTYKPGAAITVGDVADDLKAGYSAGDAWQELGGAREQQTFDMKMLALTDPAAYATARSAALATVKAATETAFNAAYKQFHEAGYSREESKTMALRAASVTKGVQEAAMAKKFGGNDSLFMGASARQSAPTHIARTAPKRAKKSRRKKV